MKETSNQSNSGADALQLGSRLLFRFGVALTLTFMMWVEVAQLNSPAWWSPHMARGALIGVILLLLSIVFGTAAVWWRVVK